MIMSRQTIDNLLSNDPGQHASAATSVTVLPAPDAVPEPVRPLGTLGTQLWSRLWTHGHRWLRPADIELAQIVAEQADERGALRFKVLSGAGWRERVQLRALEDSMVRNLALLAMTPTDRSRLGLSAINARARRR